MSPSKRIDNFRKRDQQRLREYISMLGPFVQDREAQVALQYIQALDICQLLVYSAEKTEGVGSAPLLRFGLYTIATGFWIACVAPEEWLRGQGQVHPPADFGGIVETLPAALREHLASVANQVSPDDPEKTLLSILNPITHGNALENAVRIYAAKTRGSNWALELSRIMGRLTDSFPLLIRLLAGIDLIAICDRMA